MKRVRIHWGSLLGLTMTAVLLVYPSTASQSKPEKSGQPDPSSELDWPREIKNGNLIFKLHYPQLESWDGHRLAALSAVELSEEGSEKTRYGVVSMTALASVDKNERMVSFENVSILSVAFPSDTAGESRYRSLLQDSILPRTRRITLDQFEAAIAAMEAEDQLEALSLKNDPPRILFSSVPALLVYVDGDPVFQPVTKTKLQRVINTRPLILRDGEGKLYLHLFDGWMEATAMAGPWKVSAKPHPDVKKALEDAISSGQVDLLQGQEDKENKIKKPTLSAGPVPVVYVATVPTELLVTEGEPTYSPLEGTALLYAENTTGNLFKHTENGRYYVVLSGRWFSASDLQGRWQYVPYSSLPPDFARIPDDSPKENVKASIPDTPQALEAVIANSIPQTARVQRQSARLNPPQFDGEPQLKSVGGTSLRYVVNASTPILVVDSANCYAVENGVWFKATTVKGPWEVADSVPAEIYRIPPSSPLHYVTYVRVYTSDAQSVEVGYTPGYYGAYVTHGSGYVVVYGTGYRYDPWVGTVWLGPPVTYGMGSGIAYTPWNGWSFSFGFGWHWGCPMSPVYWGWGAYPWWGPVGWAYYYPYPYWRPPYYYGGAAWGARGAVAWGPGGWAGTTGNVYHRWGSTTAVTRASGGFNAWTGNRWASQVGMSYNSRTGVLAAGQRAAVGNVYTGNYAYGKRGALTNTNTGNTVSGGRLNVGNAGSGESGSAAWLRGENSGVARVGDDLYASKDGTVYRKGESGWESNAGGGWSPVERPETPSRQPRTSTTQSPETTARTASGTRPATTQQPAARPSREVQTGPSTTPRNWNSPSVSSLERQNAGRYQGRSRTQGYHSGAYRSSGFSRGRRR